MGLAKILLGHSFLLSKKKEIDDMICLLLTHYHLNSLLNDLSHFFAKYFPVYLGLYRLNDTRRFKRHYPVSISKCFSIYC